MTVPSPPPVPASVGEPPQPMTPGQVQAVRDARRRRQPIRGAVRLATFDAWCTAVLAALSLPFAVFSPVAAVAMVALAAVATVGFVGRSMLRQLDPRGPRVLGFNQLAFFALITAYCVWRIATALTQPLDLSAYVRDEALLREALGGMDPRTLYRQIAVIAYSAIILASALFQGGLAIYYFTRSGRLAAYLEQTPRWVLDVEA